MDAQRTLRRSISCAGIGLHSGKKVTLSLKPAPADSASASAAPTWAASRFRPTSRNLGGIQYATGLTRDEGTVDTVEHLLAALVSRGVDNVDHRAEHAGSADHGRQRGAVHLPAPGSGHQAPVGRPRGT